MPAMLIFPALAEFGFHGICQSPTRGKQAVLGSSHERDTLRQDVENYGSYPMIVASVRGMKRRLKTRQEINQVFLRVSVRAYGFYGTLLLQRFCEAGLEIHLPESCLRYITVSHTYDRYSHHTSTGSSPRPTMYEPMALNAPLPERHQEISGLPTCISLGQIICGCSKLSRAVSF